MSENAEEKPKAPPTLEEIIAMPLTEAEARVQLANLDIQLAQLDKERTDVQSRMADVAVIRAIILRRTLNPQEAPADGSGD